MNRRCSCDCGHARHRYMNDALDTRVVLPGSFVYLLGSECGAVIVSRCATAGDHAAEVSCEVLEAETKKKEAEQERRRKKRRRDRGNQGSGEMEGRTSAAAANGMARGRACKIRRRRGGKRVWNKRAAGMSALLHGVRETRHADQRLEQRDCFL